LYSSHHDIPHTYPTKICCPANALTSITLIKFKVDRTVGLPSTAGPLGRAGTRRQMCVLRPTMAARCWAKYERLTQRLLDLPGTWYSAPSHSTEDAPGKIHIAV